MLGFQKNIDKFLQNTENVATVLFKYIVCYIKYIYNLGKHRKIESIVFYIWNWIGMCKIYVNQ